MSKYIERNKKYIYEYLSRNPCTICGEADPIVLVFDHRDPTVKHKNISYMRKRNYSIATIQSEIDKCDVLCSNCHARRTAKQFGWYDGIDA